MEDEESKKILTNDIKISQNNRFLFCVSLNPALITSF